MGLRLYGSTLYEFCAAPDVDRGGLGDDVRPLVHEVMDAFWCDSAQAEAVVWGAYPYDSDPAGLQSDRGPAKYGSGSCRSWRRAVARGIAP